MRENTAYFCGYFFMFKKLICGIFAVAGDFKTPFYRMDTEEKIKQALTRAAVESQGYSEDNTALYDVRLQISLDGGKT